MFIAVGADKAAHRFSELGGAFAVGLESVAFLRENPVLEMSSRREQLEGKEHRQGDITAESEKQSTTHGLCDSLWGFGPGLHNRPPVRLRAAGKLLRC